MKIFYFMVLLLILGGCNHQEATIVEKRCTSKTLPCLAALDFISARPELFEGKKVRILAYSRLKSTGLFLFANKNNLRSEGSLSMLLNLAPLIDEQIFHKQWVDVVGVVEVESNERTLYWSKLKVESIKVIGEVIEGPMPPPPSQ